MQLIGYFLMCVKYFRIIQFELVCKRNFIPDYEFYCDLNVILYATKERLSLKLLEVCYIKIVNINKNNGISAVWRFNCRNIYIIVNI